MPNSLDLHTLLNPSRRPQPQAFPQESVDSFQEQANRRMNLNVEVLRQSSEVDETGGQSEQHILIGGYSAWLQETTIPRETTDGTGVETKTRYFMGMPIDADIRLDDRLASPGWLNSWRPGNIYPLGQMVVPLSGDNGNGQIYLAQAQGQSGGEEPEWPTMIGHTISDGAISWRNVGQIRYFDVVGDNSASSIKSEKIVIVEEVR